MTVDAYIAGLRQLLANPEGRRYMLSLSVDAEEGDEAGMFDLMADTVAAVDADLSRMLRTHKADEERHAGLYRDCLARNGWTKMELPKGLGVLDHIGPARGATTGPMSTDDMIVLFASTLLVIEERGVERFPMIADAFEPYDPATAETYRAVTRDERGHVRYCHRLGRRFAVDEDAWDAAIERARAAEVVAFERAQDFAAGWIAQQGWSAPV